MKGVMWYKQSSCFYTVLLSKCGGLDNVLDRIDEEAEGRRL